MSRLHGLDPETPALSFADGAGHFVDLQDLLFARLLVMASSGAGKGWMLRHLLESTRTLVPQLVLDWEGEFSNLRDVHAYTVVGRRDEGADVEIQASTARRLARSLMASRASVVVDLSGIGTEARQEYAGLFLSELMALPQSAWHLRMVAIDEAQALCPQGEAVASSQAVKDLVARGRKRGFGVVLATQRYAKLHKDATEVGARLVGRTVQAVDLARVADELGLTRAQATELRSLPDGRFFASGRAFGPGALTLVRAGDTITKPPKLAMGLGTPAPSEIAAALAGLSLGDEGIADDAGRAEIIEEVERLREQVRSLKEGNVSEPGDITRAVGAATSPLLAKIEERDLALERCRHHAAAIFLGLGEIPPVPADAPLQTSAAEGSEDVGPDPLLAAMLDHLAGRGKVTKEDLARAVGLKNARSGKFRTLVAELKRQGLVEYPKVGTVRLVGAESG